MASTINIFTIVIIVILIESERGGRNLQQIFSTGVTYYRHLEL
jgi:hypothetical protein